MIALDISEEFRSLVDTRLVQEAALCTLRHQSAEKNAEMSIVITNDEQLKALNQQFRDVDAPTDVLAFPADFSDPENEAPYLGDIIISYSRAAEQAKDGRHAIMAELQLLVVHGALHLMGHDHGTPNERTTMWTAQGEILHQLGLGNLKISVDE